MPRSLIREIQHTYTAFSLAVQIGGVTCKGSFIVSGQFISELANVVVGMTPSVEVQ